MEWATLNQEELKQNWENARIGKELIEIIPL